uniref:RNA helicase n=1 Tax=Palpitomonas bilix TaxID=652834 RepID=A0A7S3D4P4_9EUKA|mmetsp:Transcript_21753/g.56472  ORF Transcript_21753/g.56472 Transcript_21753/m.56472 type:complete len:580 (+) Transcript_21753:327-2066(+)
MALTLRSFFAIGRRALQHVAVATAALRSIGTPPARLAGSLALNPLHIEKAERAARVRSPQLWYPATRRMKRKVILHLGPTNSGKTHGALERLKQADSGMYCAPLRLLAWEVFDRLNTLGKACDLITGQEIEEKEGSSLLSCTVEMVPTDTRVDVAVIDEMQMIGDSKRGWAWTRAFLGIQADEVHCCGDTTSEMLIRSLCELTGDECIVQEKRERLCPLVVDKRSLKGELSRLEEGDCIVAFSRRQIYDIRQRVEGLAGKKCAVVYGSLPPEARKDQARRFNDRVDGVNILVASDAVGMGLNLQIRRVIFSAVEKYDGEKRRPLSDSEVRQIAGRAGRFGSCFPIGRVSAMSKDALRFIKRALESGPLPPLEQAGFFPLVEQIEAFASALHPSSPSLSELLSLFLAKMEEARTESGSSMGGERRGNVNSFFLCSPEEIIEVSKVVEKYDMPLRHLLTLSLSPVDANDMCSLQMIKACARGLEVGQVDIPHHFTDIPRLPRRDEKRRAAVLSQLESFHKAYDLYLWLAIRFPEAFISVDQATALRDEVVKRINELLTNGVKLKAKKYERRRKKWQPRMRR